jgi:AraC-like DNA-binding protein
MILLYCRNLYDTKLVGGILSAAGDEFLECGGWAAFRSLWKGADAAVIVAPRLDADVPLDELRRFQAERPAYPCVLLTGPEPENLRQLVGIVTATVLFWRGEVKHLPGALRAAAAAAFFERVAQRVQALREMNPGLRRALVYSLRQQPGPPGGAENDEAAFARTLQVVAARIGYSERYLSRAARAAGVDLRLFLDWCVALRALHLRESTGATWESVGWRLGFTSGSGLSELLLRTFGARPAQLGAGDRERLQGAFERQFVAPAESAGRLR